MTLQKTYPEILREYYTVDIHISMEGLNVGCTDLDHIRELLEDHGLYSEMYTQFGLRLMGIVRVKVKYQKLIKPYYAAICKDENEEVDLYAVNNRDKLYILRYDREWLKQIENV